MPRASSCWSDWLFPVERGGISLLCTVIGLIRNYVVANGRRSNLGRETDVGFIKICKVESSTELYLYKNKQLPGLLKILNCFDIYGVVTFLYNSWAFRNELTPGEDITVAIYNGPQYQRWVGNVCHMVRHNLTVIVCGRCQQLPIVPWWRRTSPLSETVRLHRDGHSAMLQDVHFLHPHHSGIAKGSWWDACALIFRQKTGTIISPPLSSMWTLPLILDTCTRLLLLTSCTDTSFYRGSTPGLSQVSEKHMQINVDWLSRFPRL